LTLTQPTFRLGASRPQHLAKVFCEVSDLLFSVVTRTRSHESSKKRSFYTQFQKIGSRPAASRTRNAASRFRLAVCQSRRMVGQRATGAIEN
jgi:hypothetical protein